MSFVHLPETEVQNLQIVGLLFQCKCGHSSEGRCHILRVLGAGFEVHGCLPILGHDFLGFAVFCGSLGRHLEVDEISFNFTEIPADLQYARPSSHTCSQAQQKGRSRFQLGQTGPGTRPSMCSNFRSSFSGLDRRQVCTRQHRGRRQHRDSGIALALPCPRSTRASSYDGLWNFSVDRKPYLHCDQALIAVVIHGELLGKEIGTDGCLVLVVELAVHVPCDSRTDTLRRKNQVCKG